MTTLNTDGKKPFRSGRPVYPVDRVGLAGYLRTFRYSWCVEGDVTAPKDVQGANGIAPVENNIKGEGNNESDGYIDLDTDDCSDTASISSGASTGSTGPSLIRLFFP